MFRLDWVWMLSTATCLLLVGCGRNAPAAPQGSEKPLTILVSGDAAGWIVPCGCTSNQSGGLPRRGTLIKQLESHHDVAVLDVGGAAGGDSAYQKLKFESILAGERKMGAAAHNIGQIEASLGADYLRQVEANGAPFLSTNLRDSKGAPLTERSMTIQRGGRRLLIVGVLAPSLTPKNLSALPPRDAILDVVREQANQFDHLIVLAYLPESELLELAAGLPEADVVVGGPTGQAIAPRQVGPVLLASATNKGKFVIRLDRAATPNDHTWSGEIVELNKEFVDDPVQADNVRDYLKRLGDRAFTAEETGLAPPQARNVPSNDRTAGSESCQACHAGDFSLWVDSHHHRSWQTLERRGYSVDPACQKCHVTNYGMPGGFTSIAAPDRLLNVGCENCHGPSLAHVKNPRQRTPFRAADQCIGCHDKENSPTFAYADYWSKIRHGASGKDRGGSK